MYEIKRVEDIVLLDLQNRGIGNTVFTTYAWIEFLKKDQNIESVVLEISEDNEVVAYFVGGIIKKLGIKILGSPFAGWLTCDMGFIRLGKLNIAQGLRLVKKYAFKALKCMYVEIIDKNICKNDLPKGVKSFDTDILVKNIDMNESELLDSFSKQGKRYIRQFYDREIAKEVPFDKEFVDIYYRQLEAIFERQDLKPTFSKEKIYNLAECFSKYPKCVFVQEAFSNEGVCNGTAFTFGFGEWCYYLCAAHDREHGNSHPGEGLFWEMTKHWNNVGIKKMDLVGIRDYKMRYNPTVQKQVVIYFERIPGLHFMKDMAYNAVNLKRKIAGKFAKKK